MRSVALVVVLALASPAGAELLCKKPRSAKAAVRTVCKATEQPVSIPPVLLSSASPAPLPALIAALEAPSTGYGESTPIGAFVVEPGTYFVIGTLVTGRTMECAIGRACEDGRTRCVTETAATSSTQPDAPVNLMRLVTIANATTIALWCKSPEGAPDVRLTQPSIVAIPVRTP